MPSTTRFSFGTTSPDCPNVKIVEEARMRQRTTQRSNCIGDVRRQAQNLRPLYRQQSTASLDVSAGQLASCRKGILACPQQRTTSPRDSVVQSACPSWL